jgi:Cu/Ag efflux pump CusA
MIGAAVVALVGSFLLLQACFGSWRLATIAFIGLPVAAAGGVLAVLVAGGVMSLGSIVGFLAVLGIAARNGVVLIERYQELETREQVPFGRELVVRGARERLPHILAASLAIVAALLPIIVFGARAGLEIVQPTAVVIVGGLVASTVVTLFAIPVSYLLFGAGAQRQSDLGLATQ